MQWAPRLGHWSWLLELMEGLKAEGIPEGNGSANSSANVAAENQQNP